MSEVDDLLGVPQSERWPNANRRRNQAFFIVNLLSFRTFFGGQTALYTSSIVSALRRPLAFAYHPCGRRTASDSTIA